MKNKHKRIIDKYTQPIFPPYNLYVLVDPTKEELKELFTWGDTEEIEDEEIVDGKGVTYSMLTKKDDPTEQLCIVITLHTDYFDSSNKSDFINIISHEANHAVFRMLDYCHIKLTDDTTEVFAFVQGWITECIYKTYKNRNKHE